MSLLISTVAAGSINSVAPVVDEPCTMPGTLPRCSARTINTNRPLRSVMTSSCRYFDAEPRVYCSSVPRSFCRFWRSSLRIRFSSGLALIEDVAAGIDRVPHRRDFALERSDLRDQLSQDGEVVAGAADAGARLIDRVDEVGDHAQLQRLERAALHVERVERIRQSVSGAQRKERVAFEELDRFTRRRLRGHDDLRIARRLELRERRRPSGVSASSATASTMRSNSSVRADCISGFRPASTPPF